MAILPIKPKTQVDPAIKYRRMLNKLNLEVREKIETLDMFAPFNTAEKQKELTAIEKWKQGQQAIIYDRCYNPRPSFLKNVVSSVKKYIISLLEN